MKAMPAIKEGSAIFALNDQNNVIAGVCFGYNESIIKDERMYKVAYGDVTGSVYFSEYEYPEDDVFRTLGAALAERDRRETDETL